MYVPRMYSDTTQVCVHTSSYIIYLGLVRRINTSSGQLLRCPPSMHVSIYYTPLLSSTPPSIARVSPSSARYLLFPTAPIQ